MHPMVSLDTKVTAVCVVVAVAGWVAAESAGAPEWVGWLSLFGVGLVVPLAFSEWLDRRERRA